MTTLTSAEVKNNFSEILQKVQKGETIMITFGRNKRRIATISPIEKLPGATRKLGLLERPNSKFKIAKNFKMTDEELLNL